MALAEPLGGGLFASNVVLGLVVLIGARHHVTIQRGPFLKDAGFYLVSLLVIAAMLADGKARAEGLGTGRGGGHTAAQACRAVCCQHT
jgi:Ca2+/Na+ antiporter